jgi:prepilin-type N-terminal cleavage/methylation domain-containing protein
MMNRHRSLAASARRQAGFTLVELLIALAVTVVLLLGVLFTFDFNARVARAQTHVADMQQSLRIAQDDVVRLARMAGRGGLPLADDLPSLHTIPNGVAISLRDNVGDGEFMVAGDDATRILPGTDVLTLRGVFATVYQVNPTGALALDPPAGNPPGGTLVVSATTPALQDLAPLKTAIAQGIPEALVLVSTLDDSIHAVVELVPGASVDNGASVTLRFRTTGSELADAYGGLSTRGAFPPELTNVVSAGILEEHRYYVREEHVIAADRTSDLAPKLARARFFPASDQPYRGDASNARIELADNILDLQVVLAFDSQNGGARANDPDNVGTDDQILETADGTNDDWLFNSPADVPGDAAWQGPPQPALQYLRVTTLARTDRRDPQYEAPLLPARLENRAYAANDPVNSSASRMYRWRTLQTLIDLRNL